jgi:hypothetical protein
MKHDLRDLQKKSAALALALERGGLPPAAQEHVRRALIEARANIERLTRDDANA